MFTVVFSVVSIFAAAVAAAPSPGGGSKSTSTSSTVVNAPAVNECNYTGGQVCCNSLDYDQSAVSESLLSVVDVPIDLNLLVGHGCSPFVGLLQATCNAQAACCEKTYSGIGINCNNLAL